MRARPTVSQQTPHVRASVRLSFGDWLSLWHAGRRDGSRDLPAWYADGEFPPITPQLVAVANQAQAWFEIERVKLLGQEQQVKSRQVELKCLVATLTRRMDALAQPGMAPAPLDDRELNTRRIGETEQDVDQSTIRKRRQREYDQLSEAHERRLEETQQALDAAQTELATLPDVIEKHRERALARVSELQHLAGQRAAIYCRALVRRHARGAALASAWRNWLPKLPSWASEVGIRAI